MTTIKLKNGSGAPAASDLVQGEPALDLTNKRLYTEDSGGNVIEVGTNPTSLTTGTFTSTGIDDNATSTAITIDSSENVGIGTTSPDESLVVQGGVKIRGTNKLSFTNTSDQTYIQAASSNVLAFGTDSTERMRIDSSGNVGIGTTNTSNARATIVSAGVNGADEIALAVDHGDLSLATNQEILMRFGQAGGSGSLAQIGATYTGGTFDGALLFKTNGSGTVTERMRIDASGRVLIGTTTEGQANADDLTIANTSGDCGITLRSATTGGSKIFFSDGTSGTAEYDGYIIYDHNGNSMQFGQGNSENMRIDASGNVGIGTTAPGDYHSLSQFVVAQSGDAGITIASGTANDGRIFFADGTSGSAESEGTIAYNHANNSMSFSTSDSERMTINASGAVNIVGSLSKGSGSFKIDHPLPAKTDTHYLVHSFIEGPQADNIYRGTVNLVDGSATVNLDTAVGMSEGTFVCLNTNVQCFTSNESGWTAVKGSVSGNVLTITAQETCGDVVSWMVVGERCDQHMLDTEWTDENGRVIVEPLKGA